ncbi:hypothetical protein [Gelidibacter mesophilus]|uniref:FEKKY domain-containing protein n=1 Tax=Gelidibacter mesophilus TaxID=169050 RepID=UPI0004194A32|nr:hypothetical protein [Gelidibacter mesophilus]
MKTVISILIVTISFSSTLSAQITATIVFENHSDKTTISGVFYSSATNQSVPIHSLENISIDLPENGSYNFQFYSEDVRAFIPNPVKITHRKSTVIIKLENKPERVDLSSIPNSFLIKNISDFSREQIEEAITQNTINFICHGLVSLNSESVQSFKNEFGVGFISQNCVIDPVSFKIAMANNKRIETYLNLKYGKGWKNKLPMLPFGMQGT